MNPSLRRAYEQYQAVRAIYKRQRTNGLLALYDSLRDFRRTFKEQFLLSELLTREEIL